MMERLAVGSGLARLAIARGRARVAVLAYHDIVPDGSGGIGDSSLHLPRDLFARQLDYLGSTHDVVALDTLRSSDVNTGRPRAIITFDDGYVGALTLGVEELARRGFPATFFVSPGMPGSASFWWDQLAASFGGILPADLREHCLSTLGGDGDAIRGWAQSQGVKLAPLPHEATATDADTLKRALHVPGMSLGSHTWSHPVLPHMPHGRLREELERPIASLEAVWPAQGYWLAYPYGLWSPRVAEASRLAGYVGALALGGGRVPANLRSPAHYFVPRVNVPAGVSLEGLALRLARLWRG